MADIHSNCVRFRIYMEMLWGITITGALFCLSVFHGGKEKWEEGLQIITGGKSYFFGHRQINLHIFLSGSNYRQTNMVQLLNFFFLMFYFLGNMLHSHLMHIHLWSCPDLILYSVAYVLNSRLLQQGLLVWMFHHKYKLSRQYPVVHS